MTLFSLIQDHFNALVLLGACSFLLELLRARLQTRIDFSHPVVQGVIFSGFATLVMLDPITLSEGIIFDLRNVIIAIAGTFGGAIVAAIVSFVVVLHRLALGGAGASVGVASAIVSALLGVALFHYFQRRRRTHMNAMLIGLGVAVAAQTLAWFPVLLADAENAVFNTIAIPMLIMYPVGCWLLGNLILYQQRHAAVESAVNADRAMLRTLIDNVPDYIFIKDRAGRYLLSNAAHTRAAGAASSADLLGKTSEAFFPVKFTQQHDADDRAVLSGANIINQERKTVNAEGKPIWVSTTKVPLRNPQGQIVGIVGISRDITRGKQAEETIHHERNLLRTLIDAVPANVYIKDRQSRFLDANTETVLKFGVGSRDELIGKTDFDFSPPEYAQKYYEDEQALFETGQMLLNIEERILDCRTQEQRWLLTTKAPIRDAEGEVTGLVGVGLDITEHKYAQEQAQALAAEQQRLKLLRQFITHVSHDFRTPLTIIGTSAYLMGITTAPEVLSQRSQMIEEQIARLRMLLDNFVEIANLEQSPSAPTLPATDLDALIKSVVESKLPAAESKRQRLVYESAAGLQDVGGSGAALAKAIGHVVDNALHYTPADGEITIRLSAQADRLVVEVADTGIGIAAEHLSRIFESFYRVDAARQLASGGAGLGLSIAKRIVEWMGGCIEVQSEVGRGSVFRILLPLYQEHLDCAS